MEKIKINDLLDGLINKDISNRRELEVNNYRYLAIFNNPFDSVLILNNNFEVMDCNEKTKELLGETPIGKSLFSFIKNRDEFILQAITGKVSILATRLGKYKNKVVELFGQRIDTKLSTCSSYYIIIRDVTDRIDYYKRLDIENKIYSDLVSSFPDILIMFDEVGNIVYSSSNNLFSLDTTDNIFNLDNVFSEFNSSFVSNLDRLKQDKQLKTFDFSYGSSYFNVRLASNSSNYLLLIRDITYIKKLEKEISNQNLILDVLIDSVETLFIDSNYNRVLSQVLKLLSELFGIRHSIIFNNDYSSNDIVAKKEFIYSLNNSNFDSRYDKLRISNYVKSDVLNSLIDNRITLVSNNGFLDSFNSIINDKTVYLSPLYIKDIFWGSLVFILDSGKQFTKTEESVILLITKLIANYIQNYSQTTEIHTLYKIFTSDKNSLLWVDVKGDFIFANDSFCKKFPETNSIFEITKISKMDWDNLVSYLRDKKSTKHCYDLFMDNKFINTEVNLCYLKYLDREFVLCS